MLEASDLKRMVKVSFHESLYEDVEEKKRELYEKNRKRRHKKSILTHRTHYDCVHERLSCSFARSLFSDQENSEHSSSNRQVVVSEG